MRSGFLLTLLTFALISPVSVFANSSHPGPIPPITPGQTFEDCLLGCDDDLWTCEGEYEELIESCYEMETFAEYAGCMTAAYSGYTCGTDYAVCYASCLQYPTEDEITDSDGDGIYDANDDCPQQAGVAPHGCPAPPAPLTPDADDYDESSDSAGDDYDSGDSGEEDNAAGEDYGDDYYAELFGQDAGDDYDDDSSDDYVDPLDELFGDY